jgi:hypothetical protein
LLQTERPTLRLGALTGLALAAAWLTKISNMPLIAVALLATVVGWAGLVRKAAPPPIKPFLALLLCAALPIAAWCFWSRYAFGDFLGSGVKTYLLNWTRKPFSDWWRHPIFTPSGLGAFWSELMASFWRGEFIWGGRRLAMPFADIFYWASSLILPGVAMASLFWSRSAVTSIQRQAFWLSFWAFAAGVAFLVMTSIAFDFGACFYPSRDYPYFTSGRLLCGALIPFLLLYVQGLDKAFGWVKSDGARWLALGAVVFLITISEWIINRPAFSSQYNWFHL